MSLFIDLVETFDFYTITSEEYSEKINGLLKRFPKFKKDCRYRTVVPQKLAKSAADYISIKLCTKGRVPVYGIYTKRDLHLAAVCVEGIMYALDHASCTDLHASFVPDLKFRKVDLGIQHTPLAVTQTVSYTKETMCCTISTLSLGYMPQKKYQWCNAIVLLTGITSQAARFSEMKHDVEVGLNTQTFGRIGFYPDSRVLGTNSRWNKISKAVRSGECPYIFTYYIKNGRSTSTKTVSEEFNGRLTLSLINNKDRTKREKFRRINDEWDEKRERMRIKRKREEKRQRKYIIRILNGESNRNLRKKMTNNKILWESIKGSHGFWYGSVDTSKYKVASVKCLLRPTQMVRDNRFFVSAAPPLDGLKVVLQVQTTRASILPVVKNIWNEVGLLAFSRGTSMILESWVSNSDASGSFLLFRRPYPLYRESFLEALRAAYRAVADCMYPVFTTEEIYLCARQHKFKVDEMKLIELCATSKSEFNRVSTSMKNLCFDNCGISEEKTDPPKVNGNQEPRPFIQLGCGGHSGALGPTRVYPLQDITTRMQAQHFAANAGYSGMFDVFRRTIQHEGLRLRGFYPNLLKIVSSGMATKKLKA